MINLKFMKKAERIISAIEALARFSHKMNNLKCVTKKSKYCECMSLPHQVAADTAIVCCITQLTGTTKKKFALHNRKGHDN